MTDLLITVVIGCVLIGTFTLSFAIDFIDVDESQIEPLIDWPKAILGAALLAVAGVIAAVRWPV